MATSTALAGQAFRSTARDTAKLLGGWVVGGAPETALAGVSTDSRTIAKGNLFVALAGDAFDGHEYVAKAAASGAAAALVLASKADALKGAGIPLITVEADTLTALGKLGRAHRDAIQAPFVGITGSAGKSTAKEMTAAVLGFGGRKILKTEGNLNNRIGVPLTCMSATAEHAACVIEMGISLPGEMAALVDVASPNVRVVLNAGSSHLEFLHSPEGVAKEKAQIWDQRRQDDWMIFNADDPLVSREANARLYDNRLSFGHIGEDVRIQTATIAGFGGTEVTLIIRGKPATIRLHVFGMHHVTNVAAAAAVGLALDVPTDEIVAGLEKRFAPMHGRGDIHHLKGDVVLIDDSYNSNPTSATASIMAIAAAKRAGRKRVLAALGDMLELGPRAPEHHARVGMATAGRVDHLFLFGPNAMAVAAGSSLDSGNPAHLGIRNDINDATAEQLAAAAAPAMKDGARPRCRVFATRDELATALLAELKEGDAVLVKGSRGMKMDEVVAQVLKLRGVA